MYIPNQLEEIEFKKKVIEKKLHYRQNQRHDERVSSSGAVPAGDFFNVPPDTSVS